MPSAQSDGRPRGSLEVTVHHGDLESLAPIWMDLADPTHPGAAFRSWAWISAWWKIFSSTRKPFVLLAHQGHQVVGLLPMCVGRTPLGGRRVMLMGEYDVGSDYLGIVCRAGDGERLAHAFAEHLAPLSFDDLSLDGLMRGDPLLPALEGVFPESRAAVELRCRCPHIHIHGDFERYLAELPNGTGAQWKRRLRWLEKRPGFSIEVHSEPDAVVRNLDALFALHHKRWAVEGGSDGIYSPAHEAFHRLSARGLAERGWARLYLLHVEGAPRAALYGWRHGKRYSFYQSGYDPEWHQRSIGTVLLGEVVRRCFADGTDEFDFLHGTESYKLRWANGWRETVRLRARDASWRALIHDQGRTTYWRLRAAVREALPSPLRQLARRARRRLEQ